VLSAVANFLLATIFEHLSIPNLAGLASQLGSIVLLCAFSLLLLTGFFLTGKLVIASFCNYFSTRQRMERKVLFYTGQRTRLNRLFYFKKARLLYFNRQKRKLFLKMDNKKSVKL
jgi:hypothetical protein